MDKIDIEQANPAYSEIIGELIHQTASEVWTYLFDSNRELFERYIEGLWPLAHNTFAHTEAVVLRDTQKGTVCGLELGYRGDAKKGLGKMVGTAVENILSQQELAAMAPLEKGMSYMTAAIPPNAYYLQFFSVDPTYRGLGLGSTLMENCISRAKDLNCRSIHLDVTTDNPAVNVYKTLGFRIAAETRLPEKEMLPPLYRMVKRF